jgi:hypothetical protein
MDAALVQRLERAVERLEQLNVRKNEAQCVDVLHHEAVQRGAKIKQPRPARVSPTLNMIAGQYRERHP